MLNSLSGFSKQNASPAPRESQSLTSDSPSRCALQGRLADANFPVCRAPAIRAEAGVSGRWWVHRVTAELGRKSHKAAPHPQVGVR